MKTFSENSNAAVMKELGARIKRGRLDMHLSQKEQVSQHGPCRLPKTAETFVWRASSAYSVLWDILRI